MYVGAVFLPPPHVACTHKTHGSAAMVKEAMEKEKKKGKRAGAGDGRSSVLSLFFSGTDDPTLKREKKKAEGGGEGKGGRV